MNDYDWLLDSHRQWKHRVSVCMVKDDCNWLRYSNYRTNYNVCDINSCDIVSLDDGNVSDHLPFRILLTLRVQHYNNSIPIETGHSDSLFIN